MLLKQDRVFIQLYRANNESFLKVHELTYFSTKIRFKLWTLPERLHPAWNLNWPALHASPSFRLIPGIPSSFSPLSHERVNPFKCSASVPNTPGAHIHVASGIQGYVHIDQLVISFAYHGMTGNAQIIISCFVLHGVCTAQDTKCFNTCIIIGAHIGQLMEIRLCTMEACKENCFGA